MRADVGDQRQRGRVPRVRPRDQPVVARVRVAGADVVAPGPLVGELGHRRELRALGHAAHLPAGQRHHVAAVPAVVLALDRAGQHLSELLAAEVRARRAPPAERLQPAHDAPQAQYAER